MANHVKNVLSKTQSANRTEAAAYAVDKRPRLSAGFRNKQLSPIARFGYSAGPKLLKTANYGDVSRSLKHTLLPNRVSKGAIEMTLTFETRRHEMARIP